MGGRRLPRVCPRFRRGSTRRRPTPTPVAPGLITERAARFYLAHGIDHNGYDLLTDAAAVCRLGRDGQSRPAGLGLPEPAATFRHGGRAAQHPIS